MNTCPLRPLCQCQGLVSVGDEEVCLLIVLLLAFIGPPDITRLIVAVVVGIAIYGMLWGGAIAYIGKEIFKRVDPAFTDGDASRTVVFVSWVGRNGAAFFHSLPCFIFRCRLFSLGVSVCQFARFIQFAFQASTTQTSPINHGGTKDYPKCATVAYAQPLSIPIGRTASRFKNKPATEPLPDKIIPNPVHGTPPIVILDGYVRRLDQEIQRRVIIPTPRLGRYNETRCL